MCGRTGLNLCAADVQRACVYKKKNQDEFRTPEWVDEYNLDKEYKPSYNIAPTEVTPVLVSSANFGMGDNDEQILKPMMWGMVPPWHKGSYKNHGLSTNNCRLEGITSSKLYGSALRSGNRCVVLAEGFYEWQTTNSSKQPYYIYSNQEEGIKMEDPSSWGNSPPRLLRMAGLYGVWEGQEAGEEGEGGSLYSYSVLTLEAGSSFNWLHHRVPALLETDQQVADWLDVDRVPHSSATAMFSSSPPLSWHPVSSTVNNSRNKSPDCNRPILLKARTSGSRGLMEAWLRKPVDTEPQSKKIKKDDI